MTERSDISPFAQLVRNRRMTRAFTTEPVDREVVDDIVVSSLVVSSLVCIGGCAIANQITYYHTKLCSKLCVLLRMSSRRSYAFNIKSLFLHYLSIALVLCPCFVPPPTCCASTDFGPLLHWS